MADNVTSPLTGGNTVLIAADDVAGTKYQRVKQCFGVDGQATDVSATDPMPITVAQPTTLTVNQQTVNLVAIQLPTGACLNGFNLKSANTNAGNLWVGGAGVTASNGYQLVAGESVFVPIDNLNKIFVIGDTSNQKLQYLGT